MDVTSDNYFDLLPEITETISDCDFIAIDTELSGLLREKSDNRFDSPEERFAKEVEASKGYFILQFGLSCFKSLGNLEYTNRTYNFYIFPQALKHGDINRTLCLQAHAVHFLTHYGFDFNKLFRQGISYLTFEEKKLLSAQRKSSVKERGKIRINANGVPDFVPNGLSSFCLESIEKLNKFVDQQRRLEASKASSPNGGKGDGGEMDIITNISDRKILEFRDCSTNYRRSIMKRVFESLPVADNIMIDFTRDPETDEDYLVVEYLDKDVKNARLDDEIARARGFLEIIELIVVSKKPLVGHNLSLDLIQIINQFMEPLGVDFDAFKETCHALFPLIYDTKHIAHQIIDSKTLQNNQSRLKDLYCQLRGSSSFPKINIIQMGQSFDDNQLPHQAGYDAFMSGYNFIALSEGYLRANKMKRYIGDEKKPLAKRQQLIDEFSNRIYLPYSQAKCIIIY